MSKKKETGILRLTQALMEEQDVKDALSLQSVLKEMLKQGVEALLEAELDETLGYDRYNREESKDHYRNGKTTKNVRTDLGEVEIDTPRDRNGEFELKLLPKHSRDLSIIEDKVTSMYAKGMTQRDISAHIEKMYDLPLSAQTISNMTDKILPLIEQW